MVTTATPFIAAYLEGVRAGISEAVAASLPEGGPRGPLYTPLAEFVGQRELKEHLSIVLEAARRRGQSVDHLLFAFRQGLGNLRGVVRQRVDDAVRSVRAKVERAVGEVGGDSVGMLVDVSGETVSVQHRAS